jgi:tetratricopeptide (TPR) repeat protein
MESVQMRGLSLYRLGRPAAAIPFLERVRQWTPNANADANYVLGLWYVNSQRLDDARQAFANQFSVPPNSGSAYLLLRNLFFTRALSITYGSTVPYRFDPRIAGWLLLSKMLMQSNLPEAAADAAKKALDLTPKLPLAHFMLGEFYLFKSDPERALREFEQEREINPANSAVYATGLCGQGCPPAAGHSPAWDNRRRVDPAAGLALPQKQVRRARRAFQRNVRMGQLFHYPRLIARWTPGTGAEWWRTFSLRLNITALFSMPIALTI